MTTKDERAYQAAYRELYNREVVIWHNHDGESYRLRGCTTCKGSREALSPTETYTKRVNGAWVDVRCVITCPDCEGQAGNPIDLINVVPGLHASGDQVPASGYPTNHPQGECFPCSGVRGPKPKRVREMAGSGLRGGK